MLKTCDKRPPNQGTRGPRHWSHKTMGSTWKVEFFCQGSSSLGFRSSRLQIPFAHPVCTCGTSSLVTALSTAASSSSKEQASQCFISCQSARARQWSFWRQNKMFHSPNSDKRNSKLWWPKCGHTYTSQEEGSVCFYYLAFLDFNLVLFELENWWMEIYEILAS